MRALDTRIVEGHNFALVDLFDIDHAAKVLTKFGQAFGKLPAQVSKLTDREQEFVTTVVTGLAVDGKVVSVRLSLFAEMIRNKPWIMATLDEVGGTKGIGVNFLEETFSSRKANPDHRLHAVAARGILNALLPELTTDIKGHMRSHAALQEAAGYQNRPSDFYDVLRILDGELRLITPTDPEGHESQSKSDSRSQYYQLTHDYLVPSLREWLTRKQKETRRGRAELKLAERAAFWNAKPENRRLPDWQEYVNIRRHTDRKLWTEQQRRLMRQASRHHALSLVRRLLEAELSEVPEIVHQISQLRRWADPLLRSQQEGAAEHSRERLHVALALLTVDDSQLDSLYAWLLRSTPGEFPILRDALAEHRAKLADWLWSDAESATSDERRLRAASALAAYDPSNPRWETIRADVVQTLTRVSPEFLGDWKEALRPVRAELLGPLAAIFRNHELGELQLALATSTLADYAADDVRLLADLLNDANPQQFAGLFPVLARHGEAAIRELELELEKAVEPHWVDAPPDPAWRDVPAETRQMIETAGGMVEQRFAFCQAISRARFSDIVEQLERCGYPNFPNSFQKHCIFCGLSPKVYTTFCVGLFWRAV